MGIDYDGGIIVGRHLEDCNLDLEDEKYDKYGDIHEFLEDNGLDFMSQWYDAGEDGMIVGYKISDVSEDEMEDFIIKVSESFTKFEKLFGVKAHLMGTQDIW